MSRTPAHADPSSEPVRGPVPDLASAQASAPSPAPVPPGPVPPDPPAPEPIPDPSDPAPPSPPGPFPGPMPPGPVRPEPIAGPPAAEEDEVTEAGEESFPASDPPSYSPTTASAPKGRSGTDERT